MNRILIIDDDTELTELLTEYLGHEGFEIATASNADDGLAMALEKDPALVVLDVMLPGRSGFEVLRELRQKSRVPVLMLTARGDEVDRIVGLEMGADDYLPKPFNPRELIARIRAIQRRASFQPNTGEETSVVRVGDVELNPATRTVLCAGKEINLTAVEFSFLELLLRNAGQVVNREMLAQKVLGRPLSPYDRSIDVHISSLRRKLGEDERIKTIRSVGYQFVGIPKA